MSIRLPAAIADWRGLYPAVRAAVAAEYADEIDWSETVARPASADEFALEYVWVVLNSGMRWKIARRIYDDKVRPALLGRGKVEHGEFGHPGKREAINAVWADRHVLFGKVLAAIDEGTAAALDACVALPWIGDITKYHLAKNLGIDCAKPDRHLARIASAAGVDAHELCTALHCEFGDRIATVDYVLWRAAEMGML